MLPPFFAAGILMPVTGNLLLDSLSPADAAALKPHLKPVHLEQKRILFEAGGIVPAVYFPTGAAVSLVIGLSTGEMVEAAIVGRDGVIGASAALDGRRSMSRGIVQLEGNSLICSIEALKGAALQSTTLLSKIIRHEQALFGQAQQSTACMARHAIEARLCRWLLRARDLCGSDTLAFTQDFLAEMLGVQRSGVTLAARTLQQAGIIKYSRGKVQIIDLEALRDSACECYEAVKDHYARLLGP